LTSSWVELRRYRHSHRRNSTVADDRQCNWPSWTSYSQSARSRSFELSCVGVAIDTFPKPRLLNIWPEQKLRYAVHLTALQDKWTKFYVFLLAYSFIINCIIIVTIINLLIIVVRPWDWGDTKKVSMLVSLSQDQDLELRGQDRTSLSLSPRTASRTSRHYY